MSRPSFFSRLLRGRLRRWEQALVGGVAGLVCGLLICVAVILSSTAAPDKDAWFFVLFIAAIGATYGVIIGARAEVNPPEGDTQEVLPAQPWRREDEWIVAFVWTAAHSTPEQLIALGRELEIWRSQQPSVTRMAGLERLLSGDYPSPDGPTTYEMDSRGKMSIRNPWVFCPVIVWAAEGMGSAEAIESLSRALTPELISGVGYSIAY